MVLHGTTYINIFLLWLLEQPKLAVTNISLCFTSEVITFDQNGHNLYSQSAGEKDLSSDTQIRVIGSMKPEMCENAQKFEGSFEEKFPVTTPL